MRLARHISRLAFLVMALSSVPSIAHAQHVTFSHIDDAVPARFSTRPRPSRPPLAPTP